MFAIVPATRVVAQCSLALLAAASTAAFAAIDLPESKEQLTELGRQHRTAWELYKAFEEQADGGQRLRGNELPDWSGVYSRGGTSSTSTRIKAGTACRRRSSTPEYERRLLDKLDRISATSSSTSSAIARRRVIRAGSPSRSCASSWPTPGQTYLINEMVNDIRRVYTDGRGHVPEADRYPLYNGDSIGFWDGGGLVVHTNQLHERPDQRTQPEYTEEVETVEIWEKVDDRNIVAHVWVYDPPALLEPWYVRQTYTKLTNEDLSLRIRYWDCGENQNNEVIKTDDGSSQFRDFTFTSSDDQSAGQDE